MLTFPPDFSFVLQLVSFVILWFGLKRLLFDPVLHVLEVRQSRTSGVSREAREMKARAELSAAEYERRMQGVRQTLGVEAETTRRAMQAEERQVLTEAREQSNAQLMRLRENLSRQAEAARPTLATEARDLAARMFERVVGRPLG